MDSTDGARRPRRSASLDVRVRGRQVLLTTSLGTVMVLDQDTARQLITVLTTAVELTELP
ncbi:hypothetical protein NLX83_19885 [Allokutzneria sp. A3M-2-11 16]|uniref:hypothetical protein n=1 Tax=Allokutzneria sp. A3M-2-11 16 TaxID=2962043 RepID=UPI0020B84904|nr:hypothetical protein [Allokutzneria sp. A3M-2-11 16]MCP3801524.1 hypothetical protein [Allokutzneria sp. A3M-2-11 16]